MNNRGYSLPELLIVLTILGVLLSLATASWKQSMINTRRSEATATLYRIAAGQELFRLQHQRYATNEELPLVQPAGLGITTSASRYYAFSSEITQLGYTAYAIPMPDSSQQDDSICRQFSIDTSGRVAAQNKSGGNSTRQCWKN